MSIKSVGSSGASSPTSKVEQTEFASIDPDVLDGDSEGGSEVEGGPSLRPTMGTMFSQETQRFLNSGGGSEGFAGGGEG